MWKKALMATLAVVLVAAVGFSIYNVMSAQASSAPVTAATGVVAPGNGQGAMNGAQNQNGAAIHAATNGAAQGAQAAAGMGQGRGQGQGQGQGRGQGQRGAGAGAGTGVPSPQNGLTDWQTLEGTVSALAAPNFTLVTADGQNIPVQLGNLSYVSKIGLNLVDGQQVTLVGAYETTGSLAIQSITVDGQTYALRDATGRPLWAGGNSK